VRAHAGTVTVDSDPARGTTFRIDLQRVCHAESGIEGVG